MVALRIDTVEVFVKPTTSLTILDVCKLIGINIPRFCYHDLLSVSGNCRMCLIEIEEADKPITTACTTEVEEDLYILTDTPLVQKARENVLELLLLNHPLDCPICDQAGECDLQDQAKNFGGNFSKNYFKKKPVEDKYCGPIVKTIMTRCISCTRCVRFNSEIAGSEFYGTLSRGENTEIGSYLPSFFDSEMSANVIDLCPVGALTSSSFAAKARPWELRIKETIDITDSIHTNIYVSYKNENIIRIVPKSNTFINSGLITDKARYIYEASNNNRLITIFGEENKTHKKVNFEWENFTNSVYSNELFDSGPIHFYLNDTLDLQSLSLIKKLINKKSDYYTLCNNYNLKLGNYNFTENLHAFKKLEDSADAAFLLLGANTKIENALFNTKMRIRSNCDDIEIFTMGLSFNYNYLSYFINLNTYKIMLSLQGKVKNFSLQFSQSSKALIVIGESFKNRVSCLAALKNIFKNIITENPIAINPSKFANFEIFSLLNFKKKINKKKNKFWRSIRILNFFIKPDDNLFLRQTLKKKQHKYIKNILFHTHKSALEPRMSFSFPATTPFEEKKIYINIEHRPQQTAKIIKVSKTSRSLNSVLVHCLYHAISLNRYNSMNYSFIKYLHEIAGNKNKYNDLFYSNKSLFHKISCINIYQYMFIKISKYPLIQTIKDFYSTNNITKNSPMLNACVNNVYENFNNFNS